MSCELCEKAFLTVGSPAREKLAVRGAECLGHVAKLGCGEMLLPCMSISVVASLPAAVIDLYFRS